MEQLLICALGLGIWTGYAISEMLNEIQKKRHKEVLSFSRRKKELDKILKQRMDGYFKQVHTIKEP